MWRRLYEVHSLESFSTRSRPTTWHDAFLLCCAHSANSVGFVRGVLRPTFLLGGFPHQGPQSISLGPVSSHGQGIHGHLTGSANPPRSKCDRKGAGGGASFYTRWQSKHAVSEKGGVRHSFTRTLSVGFRGCTCAQLRVLLLTQ